MLTLIHLHLLVPPRCLERWKAIVFWREWFYASNTVPAVVSTILVVSGCIAFVHQGATHESEDLEDVWAPSTLWKRLKVRLYLHPPLHWISKEEYRAAWDRTCINVLLDKFVSRIINVTLRCAWRPGPFYKWELVPHALLVRFASHLWILAWTESVILRSCMCRTRCCLCAHRHSCNG